MALRILALAALFALAGCGGDADTRGPVSSRSGSTDVGTEPLWEEQTTAGIKALNDEDLAAAEKHFNLALATSRKIQKANYQLPHSLNNLARVYVMQERLDEAEPLYTEALDYIRDKLLAPKELVTVQHNLAQLHFKQGKLEEAKKHYARAFQVFHRTGEREPEVACLFDLAAIEARQGNLEASEQFFKMALNARELIDGRDHPRVADILEPYAKLLRAMKRDQDAADLETRARAIRDKK